MKQQCNITIQLRLDDAMAVTYINKMDGTHSQVLCDLSIQIWEWSLQRFIFLSAEHLPGKENVIADEESSTMRDRCDWMLNPQVLNRIQSWISPCDICLLSDQTAAEIFQLEARPRGGENGCIQPGLVDHQGICQSPLVLDRSLSVSGQATKLQGHIDHPTVEHTAMVPSSTGTNGGLSSLIPSEQGSGASAI